MAGRTCGSSLPPGVLEAGILSEAGLGGGVVVAGRGCRDLTSLPLVHGQLCKAQMHVCNPRGKMDWRDEELTEDGGRSRAARTLSHRLLVINIVVFPW